MLKNKQHGEEEEKEYIMYSENNDVIMNKENKGKIAEKVTEFNSKNRKVDKGREREKERKKY